jgi:hypothetical protein
MITSYILILCLSTWLFVAGLAFASTRLAKLLGAKARLSPTLCIMLPILAFLVVVAAAPAMLVGTTLLLLAHTMAGDHTRLLMRVGTPAFAALLAASSLHVPDVANLPPAPLIGASAALLMAMAFAANYQPATIGTTSIATLAALLPLLAAPFLHAPAFIGLDIALVASGLLAGLMTLAHTLPFTAARAPLALITGWLVLTAAFAGAWVPALLSGLIFAGTIAYGMMREPTTTEHYAL